MLKFFTYAAVTVLEIIKYVAIVLSIYGVLFAAMSLDNLFL